MALHEAINWGIFGVALGLLLWNAYTLIFNKGVPNIRTAPAVRKKVISLLQADAAERGKKPYTVIDLGSGNGLLTRHIAAAMPDAHVVGLEFSRQSVVWSEKMKARSGLKNLEYRQVDFFAHDVAEADAVVLYLSIYEMGRVGKKLNAELKPGTLVTSNRFRLGDGWEPVEIINVRTFYPFQKKLHVYRKA